MDFDAKELERELCRLPEVNAARVVTDGAGRPTEVHILASTAKHARQIARDVHSLAMATFGLALDHRIISVVQLAGGPGEEGVLGAPDAPGRVVVGRVTTEHTGLRVGIRVQLVREDQEATGFAEGSAASSTRPRLIAQATLEAMRELLPVAECADVEMANIMTVGIRNVALATIVFVDPPHEMAVSGSAIVRGGDDADAVARAVLDATNRRLGRLR